MTNNLLNGIHKLKSMNLKNDHRTHSIWTTNSPRQKRKEKTETHRPLRNTKIFNIYIIKGQEGLEKENEYERVCIEIMIVEHLTILMKYTNL